MNLLAKQNQNDQPSNSGSQSLGSQLKIAQRLNINTLHKVPGFPRAVSIHDT